MDQPGARGRQIGQLGLLLAATMVLGSACTAKLPEPLDPVPTPPVPTTPTSPACPQPGVRITALASDAALGLRAQGIRMVNCGTSAYDVNGFPHVVVLDAHAKPLDIRVNNGTTSIEAPGPAPLTLQPGEAAEAALVWRNTVTDGDPVNGVALEIAPLAGQPSQPVDPGAPLDLGTTGKLDVTAWHKTPTPQIPTAATTPPPTPDPKPRA